MSLQRKGTSDRVVSLHFELTCDVSDLASTVPWTSYATRLFESGSGGSTRLATRSRATAAR